MLSWQKRNLSLVMSNAKDDGRKAPKILRNHYMGKIKPHVLALYTELTALHKGHDECTMNYVLHTEFTAALPKSAGKTVSDSLLIWISKVYLQNTKRFQRLCHSATRKTTR